mmetsp:Transcript_117521/g.312629  ORF Transcript_117521/g.312629 Transcript_117521/m.312629 type:complete len:315 (-) Transcript_117521:67-1011(-)
MMLQWQPFLPLAWLVACRTVGALQAHAQSDAADALDASLPAHDSCSNTVSFLFLARDGLPLERVWRKFLDGCEPGSYTVHMHSQGDGSTPLLPEAQLVADPVGGELRKNYTMQTAMNKLYRDASRATAPNGCKPRWAQMLSESCAPLRSCSDMQALLSGSPGTSFLESWLCTVGAHADACYCRRPTQWRTPWYKAHQWSTLWMDHARMLLDREKQNVRLWDGVRVPDEHYTVNILDSLGANHTAFGLTHVYPFLPGRKAHPEDIDCSKAAKLKGPERGHVLFDASVQDVVSAGRIFARKFSASCLDSLLDNLSG